jgi:hypothetical protein
MKTKSFYQGSLVILAFAFIFSSNSYAAGYPWRNHASPYDFEFGNSFDTHQQTKINGETLQGFFYISFTGDSVEDLPEADHGTDTVGWILHGVPAMATLLAKPENEHPIWCVDPIDLPQAQGYTHFHWIGEEEQGELIVGTTYYGYILKLTAIDSFFFSHAGGFPISPGIDFISHDNVVTSCE